MSLRQDLAQEINKLEMEMREIEFKRTRSMAALMEALVSHTNPDEKEMQFFRQYSAEIEAKRDKLIELTQKLNSLE